jgi:hypothetical protein
MSVVIFMQELLGALAAAWPRVLLYPGGVAAVGLAIIVWAGRRYLLRRAPWPFDLFSATLQLSALTLMPLPFAVPFPYGLDLAMAFVLLDGPGWLQGDELPPSRPWWPLILMLLGGLALVEGSGGWQLSGMLNWRSREIVFDQVCLIAGSSLWLVGALFSGKGELRLVGHSMIAVLPWV